MKIATNYGDLYQGDCLQVMATLPDNCADMVLCDLPYGTTQNKWDSVIPIPELMQHYARLVKPNGVIVLTSQGIFTAKLIAGMETWFRYKLVWVKSKATNFLNSKKQPLRQHEDVCVFSPSTGSYYAPLMFPGEAYDKGLRKEQLTGSYGDFAPVYVVSDGLRYPTDVIYCKTPESEYDGQIYHPTQKPIDLGRYLINTYCPVNGVVLDNAFGSGSFLVAAALERRKFIGIELNQSVQRFKDGSIDCMQIVQDRLAKIGHDVYAMANKSTSRAYSDVVDALNTKAN